MQGKMRAALWQLVLAVACAAVVSCTPSAGSLRRPQTQAQGDAEHLTCSDRIERGKDLERLGHLPQALDLYEESLECALERVGLMSKDYGPARTLLQERRDELEHTAEEAVAEGRCPASDDVGLLMSLNAWLEDNERSIGLYDKLTLLPHTDAARAAHLTLWDDLVLAGRYADALRWEDDVQGDVYGALALWGSEGSDEMAREYALDVASYYVEALVGVGRIDDAKAVAVRAVGRETVADGFVLIMARARRAGDSAFLDWVISTASDHLSGVERERFDAAVQGTAGAAPPD